MGAVRRRYWLAAALHHLGKTAQFEDAEDALHTFLAEHVPDVCSKYVEANGTFDSYIWTSFKYFCWRHSRRDGARRAPLVPLDIEHDNGAVEIAIADERTLTPLHLAEVREQTLILANAVAELTPRQRACWIADVDGLSYAEGAKKLSVSENAFAVELYRARQRIQELVNHYPRTFLSVGEIRDWAGLGKGLRRDGELVDASIGRRVWELGSATLRELVRNPSLSNSPQTQAQLIHELNDVLARRDFYSSKHVNRIARGRFSTEIRGLLRRRGGPITTRHLNKLLFRNHYDQYFRK